MPAAEGPSPPPTPRRPSGGHVPAVPPRARAWRRVEVLVLVEELRRREAEMDYPVEQPHRLLGIAADRAQAGEVVGRDPRIGPGVVRLRVEARRRFGITLEARAVPRLHERLEVL